MKKKVKIKNIKKTPANPSGSTWSSYGKDVKKISNKDIETKDMSRNDSKSKQKYLIWHVQGSI